MDFIKMYWIPLILIIAGVCISLFKLIFGIEPNNRKTKHVLYQGAILIAFGIYLLVTKMFLEKTLVIICWLLGVFFVMIVMRRLRR